jgi:hypothetical protein
MRFEIMSSLLLFYYILRVAIINDTLLGQKIKLPPFARKGVRFVFLVACRRGFDVDLKMPISGKAFSAFLFSPPAALGMMRFSGYSIFDRPGENRGHDSRRQH